MFSDGNKIVSLREEDLEELTFYVHEKDEVRSAFPSEETIGSESWQIEKKLKENEYTQAVADMICGTLKGGGLYGEYEIYIDTYCMTDQTQ